MVYNLMLTDRILQKELQIWVGNIGVDKIGVGKIGVGKIWFGIDLYFLWVGKNLFRSTVPTAILAWPQ
jgi:hypothetical protein